MLIILCTGFSEKGDGVKIARFVFVF
jgi:hypothetical protein